MSKVIFKAISELTVNTLELASNLDLGEKYRNKIICLKLSKGLITFFTGDLVMHKIPTKLLKSPTLKKDLILETIEIAEGGTGLTFEDFTFSTQELISKEIFDKQ